MEVRKQPDRDSELSQIRRILVAATIFLFGGCSFEDPKPQSEDIAALREVINIDFPVKSARWEIFGTPENTGWVPGPTDFYTLIAELKPEHDWFHGITEPMDETFIVPEAARPWLTKYFRDLMDKNKHSTTDLYGQADCRKFATTVRTSGRLVRGFMCDHSQEILLYLRVSSSSETE